MVDERDNWIYDCSLLDIDEQEEVAGQITGCRNKMDELLLTIGIKKTLEGIRKSFNFRPAVMGQLLRLHFENKDHSFRILNTEPVTRETTEIDLLLDGSAHTIIRNGTAWLSKDTDGEVPNGLVQAIAKAITLRFRI